MCCLWKTRAAAHAPNNIMALFVFALASSAIVHPSLLAARRSPQVRCTAANANTAELKKQLLASAAAFKAAQEARWEETQADAKSSILNAESGNAAGAVLELIAAAAAAAAATRLVCCKCC